MQEITVPTGNNHEAIAQREIIIRKFYRDWKLKNPLQKRYNLHLKEYINIRMISIDETSFKAAKSYLSTLAVLQLDDILVNARKCSVSLAKQGNKNQKMFEKMITMKHTLVGIGSVKMTVGVRKNTHEKIQYCITAIET